MGGRDGADAMNFQADDVDFHFTIALRHPMKATVGHNKRPVTCGTGTCQVHDDNLGDEQESRESWRRLIPQQMCQTFADDGFIVVRQPILSSTDVNELNHRLELILRGQYDRGTPPDKFPRLLRTEIPGSTATHCTSARADPSSDSGMGGSGSSCDVANTALTNASTANTQSGAVALPAKVHRLNTPGTSPVPIGTARGPLGDTGNRQNVKVLQVINVHKADHLFRQLVCHPALGRLVATLAGWTQGARVAQDQVWAKPPGASALSFHRDSPYFMFQPADVVTVWIALDQMDAELGPLEYVRGSHMWNLDSADTHSAVVGSANQFFDNQRGGRDLLYAAARAAQVIPPVTLSSFSGEHDPLDIVSLASLPAGALSIHHGRTWHGSGQNTSRDRPRRGIGIHFVPAQARFTKEAIHSRLWKQYVVVRQELIVTDGDDTRVTYQEVAVDDPSQIMLPGEDFPISWCP